MGLFDKFKTSTAIDRLSEEKLYEQVAQELKAGKKREGIWVKAMAKTSGNLNKAEALYIELRVQAIKDETNLALSQRKKRQELEETMRVNREKEELERQKKISQMEARCARKLEILGYKVILNQDSESKFRDYRVIDTAPNTNHYFRTLEELCKFSDLAPRSVTQTRSDKRWLVLALVIIILFAIVSNIDDLML